MADSDPFLLSIAAVLAAYLSAKIWRRAREYPFKTQRPGHGIDVSAVSNRVRRLRGDYLAEIQALPRAPRKRRQLLSSARRVAGRLSYFRGRDAPNASHTADESETHST